MNYWTFYSPQVRVSCVLPFVWYGASESGCDYRTSCFRLAGQLVCIYIDSCFDLDELSCQVPDTVKAEGAKVESSGTTQDDRDSDDRSGLNAEGRGQGGEVV